MYVYPDLLIPVLLHEIEAHVVLKQAGCNHPDIHNADLKTQKFMEQTLNTGLE